MQLTCSSFCRSSGPTPANASLSTKRMPARAGIRGGAQRLVALAELLHACASGRACASPASSAPLKKLDLPDPLGPTAAHGYVCERHAHRVCARCLATSLSGRSAAWRGRHLLPPHGRRVKHPRLCRTYDIDLGAEGVCNQLVLVAGEPLDDDLPCATCSHASACHAACCALCRASECQAEVLAGTCCGREAYLLDVHGGRHLL